MVSNFKLVGLLSFLILAVSCGQDGFAPSLQGAPYRGLSCDDTITTNIDDAEFRSRLQAGSASDPFVLCVKSGVEIGSDSRPSEIIVDNIVIVAEQPSSTIVYNVRTDNQVIFLFDLGLRGVGGGCLVTATGADEITVDGVECVSDSIAMTVTSPSLSIASSDILSSSNIGVYFNPAVGSSFLSITDSVITAAGHGVIIGATSDGTVAEFGGTRIRANSSGGGGPFHAILSTPNVTAINDVSDGDRNFACNVSGTTTGFTSFLSGSAGTGNFNVNNTQNGSNAVGTCP